MSENSVILENITRNLSERVKLMRKSGGWTLESLSAACGVSRSMLSQIERGQANPTLAVACRIAKAFDVSVGELVEEPWIETRIEIVRANDPAHLYRSDSSCRIRTLSPLSMEKNTEFYELKLAAGAALASAPHFDGTREFLTIRKGIARLTSAQQECRLKSGDSAHYRADVEHRIQNRSSGEMLAFLVVTYPPRVWLQ